MLVITPSNYGQISYGQSSYSQYLLNQPNPPIGLTIPVVEQLVTTLAPAHIKLYFSIQN